MDPKIKEMLMLSHICAIASTIAINKKILEWLKQNHITSIWELYTNRFNIDNLCKDFNIQDINGFRKELEPLFGNLEVKLSEKEIKNYQIKTLSEQFRFDLAAMCLSFEEIRQQEKISIKLFNILTNNADLKYVWMLYENRHTETTGKPFKETFISWRGTSKISLDELENMLQQLELPELDSIKFTNEEIDILEEICK